MSYLYELILRPPFPVGLSESMAISRLCSVSLQGQRLSLRPTSRNPGTVKVPQRPFLYVPQ